MSDWPALSRFATKMSGQARMAPMMSYTGPERRQQPKHIMTVPGSRGRLRFDGTLSLGNLLIIMPILALIFTAGAWKESVHNSIEHNTSSITSAIANERLDMTAAKAQETADVAAVLDRVQKIAAQVAAMQDKIQAVQDDVKIFARSIGAPIREPAKK